MANVIYSQMDGSRDALFGKYEHKIKGFIEHESNICEKEKNILTELFNVEKSNSYSEAFTGETDFDTFMSMGEGQSAENDSVVETFRKHFIHHQFGKSFTITRQMADDAKLGMGAEMKARPKAFARAFYKTRVDAACQALIHGTENKMIFNKAEIDLTTGDQLPLFHSAHPFADAKLAKLPKQSNYFYGKVTTDGATLEASLARLANKMRNFKDENNNTMGYVADTIILPCNRPSLEMMVKKIVGSERTVGSDFNDINTQYGNWTVVVLNNWEAIKNEEKKRETMYDRLSSVPPMTPALMRAAKVSKKSEKFKNTSTDHILAELKYSLDDISKNKESLDEETLGKLLFTMSTLSSQYNLDPEEALFKYTNYFIEGFSNE